MLVSWHIWCLGREKTFVEKRTIGPNLGHNPQWFRTTTFGKKIMDEVLIVGASDNMYESFAGIFFCLKVIFGTKERKEGRKHRERECEKTKNPALGALSLMIHY